MALQWIRHAPLMGLTTGLVLLAAASAAAQEPLARAKAYYAEAAYEDALTVLDAVPEPGASAAAIEIAAYRVYCLLALGRTDDARAAVETLVGIDPLYRPGENEASPRVRSFIDEVRKPLLTNATTQVLADAREAYARKDLEAASERFSHVLALLEEIGETDDPELADTRMVAAGFKQLADAELAQARQDAAAAAEAQAEAARQAELAAAARAEADELAARLAQAEAEAAAARVIAQAALANVADPNRIYTEDDPNVAPPEARSRTMPTFSPNANEVGQEFFGVLELIVDAEGRVVSAAMRESAHAIYDRQLLEAAKRWRFKPAALNGTPVQYLYRLGIRIGGL